MFASAKVRTDGLGDLEVTVMKPRRFAEDGTPLESARISLEVGQQFHLIVSVEEWRELTGRVEAALVAAVERAVSS